MRIVSKDNWFWKSIGWILGLVGNKTFLTSFATTIGPIIAVPNEWLKEIDTYEHVMVHERRHVEQFKFWGFGNAWIGIIPMAFLYLAFPLPILFAWGRWLIERDAYLVSLRYLRSKYEKTTRTDNDLWINAQIKRWAEHAVDNLTSGNYAWTLPPFGFVKRYMVNWLLDNYRVTSGI